MGKMRSQLRFGQWPDGPTPSIHPVGLTPAARWLAANVIEELAKVGVTVSLDKAGTAHFRSRAISIARRVAGAVIETHGDLIEAYLHECGGRYDPSQ